MSVTGGKRLLAALNRIQRGGGHRRGIGTACRVVEKAAVGNCPVDTGNLQQSITAEPPGTMGDPVGIVGTNAEYAPYVEMGTGLFAAHGDGRDDVPWRYQDDKGNWHTTSGQEPQPFLQPALRDNKEAVLRLIAEGVREDLRG